MSQPKIMVFHLKELIYTMIFLLLGILLILLLLFMFLPGLGSSEDKENVSGSASTVSSAVSGSASSASLSASQDASPFYAGIYTSSYVLNNTTMEIEVILDEDHINSIRFVNLDDAVETVSPLLLPAMEDLAVQIVTTQAFDNITVPEGSEYTYQVLLEGIKETIAKGTRSTSS